MRKIIDSTIYRRLQSHPGRGAATVPYSGSNQARLGALFHLEDQWKDLDADERQKHRLKESKPLADAFFVWLGSLGVLPQSTMGKAISYAFGQRRWLMNFYLDGRCELSNNRAENSIRPFVVGRKNWLFCNTQKGARASSVAYSIIETAKANGLNPFAYLQFLFEMVPSTTTAGLRLSLNPSMSCGFAAYSTPALFSIKYNLLNFRLLELAKL